MRIMGELKEKGSVIAQPTNQTASELSKYGESKSQNDDDDNPTWMRKVQRKKKEKNLNQ